MMIIEKIQKDLKEAMKTRDEARVLALRFLLAALQNAAITLRRVSTPSSTRGAQGDLSDEETIQVIQRQAKERKESIAAFKVGNREDLVKKEQAELEILNKYLPQQLSAEELEKLVSQAIEEVKPSGMSDFGKVMGTLMVKVKGQVDGTIVSEMVKKRLTGG